MKCPKHIQSGHSAFFKKKANARKCMKKIRRNEPNQTRMKIKKTIHTLRGKGWLLEA